MMRTVYFTNEIMYTDEFESDKIIGILPVFERPEDIPSRATPIPLEVRREGD